MSLRIFHVVFILASFGLSLFVVLWALRNHSIGLAIVFALFGVALVWYGFHFFGALKDLDE